MARAPGKHGRDQALDFQGFLNDLQDWELLKDTDKKVKTKSQASDKIGEDGRSKGKTSAVDSSRSGSGQYDYSRNFGAINRLSSNFTTDEITVDATTEKELGNEYFKQKKFNEAIECYSRSIALSPTAVAYANRAMAYLKIKRFREAEDDCTETLNLDDHYIKAYSRRATARKELGKLKESIEDSEFALKLEPINQEIKKQYAEVKSLYEKEILQKASGALRSSLQGTQKGGRSEASVNGHAVHPVSIPTQNTGVSASKKDNTKENDGNNLVKKSVRVKEVRNKGTGAGSKSDGHVGNDSPANATLSSSVDSVQKNNRTQRQELKTSVMELASQAASRAMAEAAKNITPPNSAYQFEVSWRGFSGDRALQAHLLKVTSPSALPQIFKNALSVPILIDIIKCVASFFIDDMDLAVKYLENLTKVPRFGVLIMCLSSTDTSDLLKMWDGVFCSASTPIEYAEILDNLRSKYCPKY
ncbi:PREDICTED: RNA polymerase II-associated protein 3-like isoform X3 [Populus euphratica]|uniref:RNA polymerase II-associated protein 3-like isoform X3 n=1 Tax=Populus euphratica TaxID=75702 RepID=A0AAJ6V125_POPEU|nr:PREDICTED: RNA polymerase II-associated protein 3-like isoform X3 [Populus euphratica]